MYVINIIQEFYLKNLLIYHFILDVQFRSFKTERISSKENDEKMINRLREMLLLPKGSDLKGTDLFSGMESNKWKGK